ncbi:hypothetical protein EVAR_40459_1 [Eumeta japonica]|uniref:Uncharacterized protein n=1 Tax=Eumeta variegata TaxID=151549 RepID=A0A4C1X2B2_EUMVA|nr:hypothetical protein EVAR_40459_1 [Eumeta japonica]
MLNLPAETVLSYRGVMETPCLPQIQVLHRVRPDGTCECRRRVTCADDAWWKSSRHRMSQETVTGRFLPTGRRRLAAAGWSRSLGR